MVSFIALSNYLVYNLLLLIIMFDKSYLYSKSIVVDLGTANSKFGLSGDE
jgi:hypothetical protein